MSLPADQHVHSEWSWDASYGSMEQTCRRALEIGLPAVAFTEHLDHAAWRADPEDFDEAHAPLRRLVVDGVLTPPRFDADGYADCLARCRASFPDLVIISGVEVGEPHRHAAQVSAVLASGEFQRVLGSLHTLRVDGELLEMPGAFRVLDAAEVIRRYLAEVIELVTTSDAFSVLAHLDYPLRYWPATDGPFRPELFEVEYREALRALAASGRALEINTAGALRPAFIGWWRDVGGAAVSFGSDAHEPGRVGRGFTEARELAEAYGFRPGRHPYDLWTRG